MKRFLLALALLLIPSTGWAQCNGVFANNTVCGNNTGTSNIPRAVSPATFLGAAGGTNGQTQYNNASTLGGYTPNGDCTVVTATGVFTCLKTNGVSFGPFATANAAAATAALNVFTSTLQGVAPASGGGTANFLRADSTFAVPPGTGVTSVTCGTGLSGGTITATGTCAVQNQVLINTLTASNSATLSDTTSLTATYSAYVIEFQNLLPATNTVTANLLVHEAGTFPATNYQGTTLVAGAAVAGINTTTAIQLSNTTAVQNTGSGLSGTIKVFNPSQTASPKTWNGHFGHLNSTPLMQTILVSGMWNGGNNAIDGFQFSFSAGNITSGVIKIYGIQ